MDNKKKYHGGLSALFVTLFAFLCLDFCVPFSSCYARTTLTDEEASYIFDYIFTETYDTTSVLNLTDNNQYRVNKSNIYQNGQLAFKNWFNANNTLDIDPNTTIFFHRSFGNNVSGYPNVFYYGNFNNSKPSGANLPFLYIIFNTSFSNRLDFLAIDDNKNIVSNVPIGAFNYTFSNASITYSNYRVGTLSTSPTYNFRWLDKSSNWNIENINKGDSVLQNIPGVISFSSTNAIYTNYNGQAYFNTPVTRLLFSPYSPTPVEPDNPDNPTDTGNTGTITNNSGETTGSIDLSGITSGINKIDQKIPSSRRY